MLYFPLTLRLPNAFLLCLVPYMTVVPSCSWTDSFTHERQRTNATKWVSHNCPYLLHGLKCQHFYGSTKAFQCKGDHIRCQQTGGMGENHVLNSSAWLTSISLLSSEKLWKRCSLVYVAWTPLWNFPMPPDKYHNLLLNPSTAIGCRIGKSLSSRPLPVHKGLEGKNDWQPDWLVLEREDWSRWMFFDISPSSFAQAPKRPRNEVEDWEVGDTSSSLGIQMLLQYD